MRKNGTMAASLLASPDHLGVAWLHLFAADASPGIEFAWASLWPAAEEILVGRHADCLWVMATQDWLIDLIRSSGFQEAGRVIGFCRPLSPPQPIPRIREDILPMQASDLPAVEELDHAAFEPPWQMDSDALRATLDRAALAGIVRRESRAAGYFIAIASSHSIHLARLAVDPRVQGQGIGRSMVSHLLDTFAREGAPWVTVNTQSDNLRSQKLYRSMGFTEMEEVYPVFRKIFTAPPP
jgi:ribosomal protein S18 acetylase RimI-like enzyme